MSAALEQYRRAKGEHPDAIVMFRLGDFLEMFFEDAELASSVLGITLTSRELGRGQRCPMAGIPYHAQDAYIAKLLHAGHRVAICDQVEEASAAKGVVRREVVRVLSPGTLIESSFLSEKEARRLVAIHTRGDTAGVAAIDVAASHIELREIPVTRLGALLQALNAAEVLVAEGAEPPVPGLATSSLPAGAFDARAGERDLAAALGVTRLDGLGAAELTLALAAAAAALRYTRRSHLDPLQGGLTLAVRSDAEAMLLDEATRRNLELFVDARGRREGSVWALLDRCLTPMGSRLLADWLAAPLTDRDQLHDRQQLVAELTLRSAGDPVRSALRQVRDIQRLTTRAVQGLASPRDLVALARSLLATGELAGLQGGEELLVLAGRCRYQGAAASAILAALVEDPPATAREGGFIRGGYDAGLDEVLARSAEARRYIATLEVAERERTGIRNLKLGFNRVFGYYLEVSHANRDRVPDEYIRRQTLAGAERYVTAELKEQEGHVLKADGAALKREMELLAELCQAVREEAALILEVGRAVASLDVLQALAEAGSQPGWCMPRLVDEQRLCLASSRHPLVERALGAAFVPNDVDLGAGRRIMLLTGPNMAGKSTFLRQLGIAVVLAQIGAFVPAEAAEIGVADRVFTRVGAHDDIARGLSTFMLEMVETAAILNGATSRSLVLIDELGRGTSTYDGLSIARAVIENLHEDPDRRPLAVVATHFHELTALEDSLPALANFRMDVSEAGEDVVFLHRVVEGGADRSYGIHVARLAGLPRRVVARAREVLAQLESERPLGESNPGVQQIGLPLEAASPLAQRLEQLDLDNLTPLEALNQLHLLRAEALKP